MDISATAQAAEAGLGVVAALAPTPLIGGVAKLLQTGIALAEQGSAVYDFLTAAAARVDAAQAAGRDLSDDDWAFIDQAAAQNLDALKAYTPSGPAAGA